MVSKYGNVKVTIDGHKFDSRTEGDYYYKLKIDKANGLIKDFKIHPTFVLQEKFKYNGKTIAAITYTPDFEVENLDGTIDMIDVKGVKTEAFKLKEKLFKYKYPQYNFFCVALQKETWIKK